MGAAQSTTSNKKLRKRKDIQQRANRVDIKPYSVDSDINRSQTNGILKAGTQSGESTPAYLQRLDNPTDSAVSRAEGKFTEEELQKIKRDFAKFSKSGAMGKKKLIEYFNLQDIENTYISNRFFNVINSMNASSKNYLDYEKFIQAVSLFSKGDIDEKLRFIFQLFDFNGSEIIEKRELKNVIVSFYDAFMGLSYSEKEAEFLKDKLVNTHESIVYEAIEAYTDEIFEQFSSTTNYLTFEEWKRWFTSLQGIDGILSMLVSFDDDPEEDDDDDEDSDDDDNENDNYVHTKNHQNNHLHESEQMREDEFRQQYSRGYAV